MQFDVILRASRLEMIAIVESNARQPYPHVARLVPRSVGQHVGELIDKLGVHRHELPWIWLGNVVSSWDPETQSGFTISATKLCDEGVLPSPLGENCTVSSEITRWKSLSPSLPASTLTCTRRASTTRTVCSRLVRVVLSPWAGIVGCGRLTRSCSVAVTGLLKSTKVMPGSEPTLTAHRSKPPHVWPFTTPGHSSPTNTNAMIVRMIFPRAGVMRRRREKRCASDQELVKWSIF